MTTDPRAFATVDHGTASVAVAIVGKVGRAWRLLGSGSLPGACGPDVAIDAVLDRIRAADPDLATRLGLEVDAADQLVRLEVRSSPARTIGVVAATERSLGPLRAAAERSGWRTVGASTQTTDPLAMSTMLLDQATDAILVGAMDPPAADERSSMGELAALVAAVAVRRPDCLVILAGGMADRQAVFGDPADRPGEMVLAPAAGLGAAGTPLQDLLLQLSATPDDARRALARATATLAAVTDRRVEVVEIGHDGGARIVARPAVGADPGTVDVALVPAAGIAPAEPDDGLVDAVLQWSTVVADRHRVRDRLRELRIAAWSDATGDGLAFRVSVAHAALARLVAGSGDPAPDRTPDLVVASGGIWSSMPASLVALTMADVLRRPGTTQLAMDHARLLAPLGAIPAAEERRAVIADLHDDLLAPLGTLVAAAGMRHGRSAGQVIVHGPLAPTTTELAQGGLAVVPLAPGDAAVAEFRFRDSVRMGGRGRRFAVDVAGGLTGLLVDLRDIPLHLPDRADARREQLLAWQAAVRPGHTA